MQCNKLKKDNIIMKYEYYVFTILDKIIKLISMLIIYYLFACSYFYQSSEMNAIQDLY